MMGLGQEWGIVGDISKIVYLVFKLVIYRSLSGACGAVVNPLT